MTTRQPTPNILDEIMPGPARQPETVPAGHIRTDGGTQMRAGLNDDTVAEYAEQMADGWGDFPPVVLYHDGQTLWLGDGFHRLAAFLSHGGLRPGVPIPAIIHAGDRRDAILHAAGANANHGLRRSNADKHRAVQALLRDNEWSQWSDGEIARRCMVSQPFVSKLRRESTQNGFESTTLRRTADGRTINTANIGQTRPDPRRGESATRPPAVDGTPGMSTYRVNHDGPEPTLIEKRPYSSADPAPKFTTLADYAATHNQDGTPITDTKPVAAPDKSPQIFAQKTTTPVGTPAKYLSLRLQNARGILLDNAAEYNELLPNHVGALEEIGDMITAAIEALDNPTVAQILPTPPEPAPDLPHWRDGWTEDDQAEWDRILVAEVWEDDEFSRPRVVLRLLEAETDPDFHPALRRRYHELIAA